MRTYNDVFSENKTALIPFFVVGDPTPEASLELIKSAIDAGADVLELGIPFSDPIADGPVIQKADVRALEQGVNCDKAFEIIRKVKDYKDIPIGLLMYYNLITHYGVDEFFKAAAAAGVNSVLIADLCVDDAEEVEVAIKKYGLDTVYMVTPNTSMDRKEKIATLCTGFIYTVSVLGVTGARAKLSDMVIPLIESLKGMTTVPVCVGFGVSGPEQAIQLTKAGADGVIVGSAIVKIIEENMDSADYGQAKLVRFIKEMKQAIESAV